MSDSASPPTVSVRKSPARWLWRICVVLFFVVGLGLITLRELVVPRLGDYRDEIATALSESIGQRVHIGRLHADWGGLRPRLDLADVVLYDAFDRPALQLPGVKATLSLASLTRWQPVFQRLEIVSPELVVRRTADGHVEVAGIEVFGGTNAQQASSGNGQGGMTWLAGQQEIVIRGAQLTWVDELREAPALSLTEVDFKLERGLRDYRFALKGLPPDELASELDFRGRLDRLNLVPEEWRGELYLALDRANLADWQSWLDYPVPLQGTGGVRARAELRGREMTSITADVSLEQVVTQFGETLPELQLAKLEGRLSAGLTQSGFRLGAQGLTFSTQDGVEAAGTDFELRIDENGGSVRTNRLDVALLARMAARFPIPDKLRERLAAFEPQGTVSDLHREWQGEEFASASWKLATRVEGVGLTARNHVPGLGGLSGEIEGNDQEGSFHFAGRDAYVDFPEIFDAARLSFSTFEANGGWSRPDGRLQIQVNAASFDNPDAAGTASGKYWPQPGSRGDIDLQAQLTRADSTSIWRYLPKTVNPKSAAWVKTAIGRAQIESTQLDLRGPLDRFPFRGDEGTFYVGIRLADGNLDYAPGWPSIEGIAGEVRFEGPGMHIAASRGKIYGIALSDVTVDIEDMGVPNSLMTIVGKAEGPTDDFLRYVGNSPVAGKIGNFTAGMRAEGRGKLAIEIRMPLKEVNSTQLQGEYRFTGNKLWLLQGLPPLENASGQFSITEKTFAVSNGRANFMGEPLTLSATTDKNQALKLNIDGKLNAAALQREYGLPWLTNLKGGASWRGELQVAKQNTRFKLTSSLQGLASELPAPFDKKADERWPLSVDMAFAEKGRRATVKATAGEQLAVKLDLVRNKTGWQLTGGGIGLNRPVASAENALRIDAGFESLDADQWRRLSGGKQVGTRKTQGAVALALPPLRVDMEAKQLRFFDRSFDNAKVRASLEGSQLGASFSSDQTSGELGWHGEGAGTLAVHLERLALDDGGDESGRTLPEFKDETETKSLPALDILIDRFAYGKRELGMLKLNARHHGKQWQLTGLELINPDAKLKAAGRWTPGARQHTEIDFTLETVNIGNLIQRVGYPDAVRGGTATLSGRVGWQGAPTKINYATLSGQMALNAAKGQFNKLEPGVGRLLGILSLQALPRRISLDFRDVFSEGFIFDSITGSVQAENGKLSTSDLEIRGPAARIQMTGTADVPNETQDLKVQVQPTMSETVAVAAGAGLVNPVAGVVVYIAQKALQDPVEKIFAYQYAITGTWQDPQVEKVSRNPAQEADDKNDNGVNPFGLSGLE